MRSVSTFSSILLVCIRCYAISDMVQRNGEETVLFTQIILNIIIYMWKYLNILLLIAMHGVLSHLLNKIDETAICVFDVSSGIFHLFRYLCKICHETTNECHNAMSQSKTPWCEQDKQIYVQKIIPSNWLLSRDRNGGFALVDGSPNAVGVSDVANSRWSFGAGGIASDSR